jgi:hypothetical protein
MKAVMRKQFVPNFYYRELFQKLQSKTLGFEKCGRLSQGDEDCND